MNTLCLRSKYEIITSSMFFLTFFGFVHYLKKFHGGFLTRKKLTRIVFRSDNFVVIEKAFDVKINSNNKEEETIQTFLKKHLPDMASSSLHHEYYFMHRLDYSTSGLMCIPVHKKACQEASKAMQSRTSRKYYIALVRGLLSTDLLELDFAIGRNETVVEIEKMCVVENATKGAKSARTLIAVLEKGLFDNYPATKILIRPITGRRHQIRVHCSHLGHTIVGDYTYSNRKDTFPFRMFLHSFKLGIPNAVEDLDVESEDPFTELKIRNWKPLFHVKRLSEALEELSKLS